MVSAKKFCLIGFLFYSSFSRAICASGINPEEVNVNELSEDVLFVGLGSYCEAADILRSCGVRKAAFPFDWILSSGGEKLIEVLKDDFIHFTEEKHLVPAKSSNMILLQSYYKMEFHHEGEWMVESDYSYQNLEKLIKKYQKRIKRFRQLKNFKGKVFFIRFSNKYSMEPNVFYRFEENLEITEEYSIKLERALRDYFPDLDFRLIIVNIHNLEGISEEKELLGNLLMIRSNPKQPLSIKSSAYAKFFNKLISQEFTIPTNE